MQFTPLTGISLSYKEKMVRFVKSITAPNLSNQFGYSQKFPTPISIPVGSIGQIYEVRGATLFIGFGADLKMEPNVSSSTHYAATIQLYLDSVDCIEVEV